MDAFLNQLLFVLSLEIVADGFVALGIDVTLLLLVLFDAFDVDLEGSLDGVLEHEVPDCWAGLHTLD